MDFRVDGVSNVVEEMMTNQFGPVDRVGSINEVGKNLAEETKSVLSRYNDQLSISVVGRHMNEIYSQVQETGSDEAVAGFRDMVMDIARTPDTMETFRFVDTTTGLAEADDGDALAGAFETVGGLYETGENARGWFDNMHEMDTEKMDSYVEITDNFLTAESDLSEDAITRFINLVENIQESADLEQEDIDNLMDQLFTGVEEQGSISGAVEYMESFSNNVL